MVLGLITGVVVGVRTSEMEAEGIAGEGDLEKKGAGEILRSLLSF